MSSNAARQREIREIVIAANGEEATEAQLARLEELIQLDPALAAYAVQLFDQQAALVWRGALSGMSDSFQVAEGLGVNANRNEEQPQATRRITKSVFALSSGWPSVAVGIAFVVGAVISALTFSGIGSRREPIQPAIGSSVAAPIYQARLTRSTACLWDNSSVAFPEIGSWLTSGESLHLLEGLAEFTLQWSRGGNATLSLEGPAAMMLTTEGMPMLRFGRLSATVNSSQRPFVLETPVGRLIVSEFGSIGASAFGNDGEIHVFDGEALLEPAWRTTFEQRNVPVKIEAGEAVRVQEGPNGELAITRHPSDKAYFVAKLSMSSDALIVPQAYVNAIKQSSPLAYWRFERDAWPVVPNQMSNRFEGHVEGALGAASYHGNQVLEFGVTDQGGEIICDEELNGDIDDAYSVEFWIKPSHYHVGAVFSMIGKPETPSDVIPHAMLLELGGTGKIPTALHHPGRMRFLHRSPPSNDSDLGTSCYSTNAYTLRKWQHVVAVKDASSMRLYFNGQLVADGEDFTATPQGLRLLVGRLYPSRQVRPFIGQLDELAIYNRPLTPREIKNHYRLIRPKVAKEPSI